MSQPEQGMGSLRRTAGRHAHCLGWYSPPWFWQRLITVRGRPVTVMAFTVAAGAITAIRLLTDPDRLAQIVPSWIT
jgi:hypothetical protein